MKDLLKQSALERIEKAIKETDTGYNFRECLIISLILKQLKVSDALKIKETGKLGCDIHDLMVIVALKYKMYIFDLEKWVTDKGFIQAVKDSTENKELSLLDQACVSALCSSFDLVKEISEITETDSFKKMDLDDPIASIFEEKTHALLTIIMSDSFECFRNYFECELLFARKDESALTFRCEIALDGMEMEKGLTGRVPFPEEFGMWYEFGNEIQPGCITEGVWADLSVAYISKDYVINEIVDRKMDDSTVVYPKKPCSYMLEVPKGWFAAHNLCEGDKVIRRKIFAIG